MLSVESGQNPVRYAFLDLETTGMDASRDRITEIGVVWVEGTATTGEWSTLINPGIAIPPEIQALTGISNAMVRDAPPFSAVAEELRERLKGCVLVAHSARFDYGFLKAAFRTLGHRFQTDILCTLRLSRQMFPQYDRHGLDALILRHQLGGDGRHRALGDARLIAQFFQQMAVCEHAAKLSDALGRLLKYPAKPDHLPEDALEHLPEGPGVYTFLGVNGQPLYIGKARNLRDRVRSHFYADSSNSTDSRLAREAYGLEIEETAGEFCALVREIQLIRSHAPLHNIALRRREANCFIQMAGAGDAPAFVPLARFDPGAATGLYGPFSTRQAARAALAALGRHHRLCDGAIGLWTGNRACFSRQIGRCLGLCCGEELPDDHHRRMLQAMAALGFPEWPYSGPIRFTETNPDSQRSQTLLFDQWCVLDPSKPDRPEFHPEIFKLLRRTLARQPSRFGELMDTHESSEAADSFRSSSLSEVRAA